MEDLSIHWVWRRETTLARRQTIGFVDPEKGGPHPISGYIRPITVKIGNRPL
jgi:hypothetical protein